MVTKSRPVITKAGVRKCFRAAGWQRSYGFEPLDENIPHIRRIAVGSNPADKNAQKQGLVFKSRPLVAMAGVSQIKFRKQDG